MQNIKHSEICPLLSAGAETTFYCKADNCAWWSPADNGCAVFALADRLEVLADSAAFTNNERRA